MVRRTLMALAVALTALTTPTAPPASAATSVTSLAVTFTVENRNGTSLPCEADGKTYLLRGRVIGPTTALATGSVSRVNLLVHDITTGAWFWTMPGHPDLSYAHQLARQGETSVVIDRLGYDASPHPAGRATCLGAQADMVHQVLTRLRSGEYGGATTPAFDEVVLHGHSVGAALAEVVAATWQDAAGLVLMAWTDSGASPRAILEAGAQNLVCLRGGDPALTDRPYAYYGQSTAAFRSLLFRTASAEVQADAARLRNPDPCGDAVSLAPTVVALNLLTRRITVPVLLLFGERDALNLATGRLLQPLAYGTGADVSAYLLPGTGSALPLEATAATTRQRVLTWLCTRFGC